MSTTDKSENPAEVAPECDVFPHCHQPLLHAGWCDRLTSEQADQDIAAARTTQLAGDSRTGTSNPYADPQDTITGVAAVIGDAAWRVNWAVGKEHTPEAQHLALQALVTCYAYTTAVAMETLRRVDPDAAERVAAHFDSDPDGLMLDIKHENAHNWEQALRSGQTIPTDAWPFPEITGEPAGEHHAGTLNLTGQGNPATSPISDEIVRDASFTIAGHRTPGWSELPDAMQAVEAASYAKAMRTTLEAAYPAIRQQVAEEIATAIERQYDDRGPHGQRALEAAAQTARQIGAQA